MKFSDWHFNLQLTPNSLFKGVNLSHAGIIKQTDISNAIGAFEALDLGSTPGCKLNMAHHYGWITRLKPLKPTTISKNQNH